MVFNIFLLSSIMGILSRLFGSKPKEVKSVKIKEAMDFFKAEAHESEKQTHQQILELKASIPTTMKNIRTAFEKLAAAKVPEERAKGSEQAKDAFVNKAMKLMDNMKEDDYLNMEKVSSFLSSIINMTPRQALHMDFFFKDELMDIGAALKKLKTTLDEIDKLQNAGILKQRDLLEKLLKDYEDAKERIEVDTEKIKELEKSREEWHSEVKDKTETLNHIDIDGLTHAKRELEDLEEDKESLNQTIDSAFGPAERFLKKYHYSLESGVDTEVAMNDEEKRILKVYTGSLPHVAFEQDENLVIKQILEKSLTHLRNDPDAFDAKKAEKVDSLISELGSLAKDRSAIEELNILIDDKKKEIENVWSPKLKEKKSVEKEIDDLTANIVSIEREVVDLRQDMELKNKKLPSIKDEISQLLSAATGKQVEVVE